MSTAEASAVHEITIVVTPADIDVMGHVNNVAYVRWVQEVAEAHWYARAPRDMQEQLLWVVLRHEIDYKHEAHLGDSIRACTWVGQATRARFERFTELRRVSDGKVLARARTVWCPIDAHTRRPAGVSAELLQLFPPPATE